MPTYPPGSLVGQPGCAQKKWRRHPACLPVPSAAAAPSVTPVTDIAGPAPTTPAPTSFVAADTAPHSINPVVDPNQGTVAPEMLNPGPSNQVEAPAAWPVQAPVAKRVSPPTRVPTIWWVIGGVALLIAFLYYRGAL